MVQFESSASSNEICKAKPMRNLIGTTLNQYQIQLKVRETGARVLYKAYDTKTFHTVALEVVKARIPEPEILYQALSQQAKKNAELVHPSIPVVVDSGIQEDLIFFVYNFSPLHPLRRLFNKTYPWQELARDLVPITKSLAVAHEHKVFHGCLNPTSIVLDENKVPVLFDFGFEQIVSNYLVRKIPGSWMKNWGYEYCSPEQLMGDQIDCRSDVYAMGMILHEWLTGETAFLDESAFGTLQKRKSASTRELSLGEDVPPVVQKLVRKCLATNPDDRYQTMQELSILLSRSALDLPITDKMIENPFVSPPPSRPLKRWAIAFLALLLVIAGVGLTFRDKLSPLLGIQTQSGTPTVPSSFIPVNEPIVTAATVEATNPPPEITGTPAPRQNPYPLFQNTPLPRRARILNPGNADEIVTVSLWGGGDINRLATSPDGTYIAVGSSVGIFVFDPNGLTLQRHIATNAQVTALEFSADGKLLAVGDEYGLIRVWDTVSWEEVSSLSGHRLAILDMAFSSDSAQLVSVSQDNTLIQWDLSAGRDALHPSTPVAAVTSVIFCRGDQVICTGGNDFKINLWSATNLSLLRTITISSKVIDMVTLPASSLLMVGGADRQMTLLDLDGIAETRRISGIRYPLSSMAASPDGKIIVASDINGGIFAWDKERTLLWKVPNPEGLVQAENSLGFAHSLAFSSDGKTLFSALRRGTLQAFDTLSGKTVLQDASLDVHARKIGVSPDSKYAISENGNGQLMVWDLYGGKYLYEVSGQIMEGSPFSPNSDYFAVAFSPATVKVYQLSSGREVYAFNGHQGIKAIRFLDHGIMVAAGYEQKMHLWSMSSGQEVITERTYPGNGCTAINTLKGNAVFSITKHNHIIAGNESSSLCGLQKPDWMKTFFIDDSTGRVVYGGSSKLSVIGAPGAAPLEMNGVNRQNIVSIAIHPDGKLLAAAFDDNTIHLWDTTSQLELMRLYGHTSLVTALQFSPDGKLLLSTSLDGTIRIWGIPD